MTLLNIATKNIRNKCRRLANINGNYLPMADPILLPLTLAKRRQGTSKYTFPKELNPKHLSLQCITPSPRIDILQPLKPRYLCPDCATLDTRTAHCQVIISRRKYVWGPRTDVMFFLECHMCKFGLVEKSLSTYCRWRL